MRPVLKILAALLILCGAVAPAFAQQSTTAPGGPPLSISPLLSGGLRIGAPVTGCASPGFVLYNNSGLLGCEAVSGVGTVTSVAASSTGSSMSLTGTNPITGSGTINFELNLAHAQTWTGQQTFVAPVLGTPASGLLTNATGLPLGSGVTGNLPNANLASQTANTVLGALTATTPSGLAMPSCSGATSALTWTTASGFGCNTISAGGSGTVNSGTTGQMTWYGSTGTAVSGNANATISGSTLTLGVAGSAVGGLALANATSGSLTLAPPTGALGAVTVTIPAATDTLVNLTGTQTLTNKTLTAPTMTAPVLGTPASGNGSNLTALNASALSTGTVPAAQLPLATTGAFGAIKPDGSTITISAGIISAVGGGTGCTVSGSTSNVQYNSAGSCAGNGGFVYDGTSVAGLGVAGTSVGGLKFNNATSGFVELLPTTGALGSSALTLPAVTDTLAGIAATQTLTNKTISTASNTITSGSASVLGVVQVDGQTIVANAGVISGQAPNRTVTSCGSCTLLATDMGGQVNFNGASLTLTIPAISSTVLAAKMTFRAVNQNSSAVTISTTPTINGFAGTSMAQNTGIDCTSNGTSLDCVALSAAGGGGSGTVNSGTAGQMAWYASSTTAVSGNANATISSSTLTLGVAGSAVGGLALANATSGSVTLKPTTGALGSAVITVPAATDTLDLLGTAQTFTAVKTFGTNNLAMTNATSGTITLAPVTGALGTVTASLPANTGILAELNLAQSWTAPQRTNTNSPTISTATFTPVFSTSQNYRIALSSACPCTLANPAAIVAGQSGMFEVVQDATGSRTIGTYGSEYEYAGGTSTITLSTSANAVDYIPYYVDSTGSFIVMGGIILKPVH